MELVKLVKLAGFDSRYMGKNGTLFGTGVYFADNA
jgi:hypothetical protein